MKFVLIFLLAFGLFAAPVSSLAGSASAPCPLDSWIYPALDKLGGLGLIESSLQGSRPYTRLEAARLFAEALDHEADPGLPPVARELLRRLEVELREPLAELDGRGGNAASGYFKPLRRADLRYLSKDGQPSPYPATGARQFALNYNNFGLDYGDENARLTFESEARLGRALLLDARPLLLWRDGDGGGDSTSLRLLTGEVALQLGVIELSGGRQSLWWGQGRHGSLILTNNAKPLDMLRVTNPSPVLLPWIFKALGPFRFDLFASRLEEDRTVPEPYFGGIRVDFKPFPFLEFGASRTLMVGGEGNPDVTFDDFLDLIIGENLSGDNDSSNSLAAIDLRLKFPFLYGAELYGEWGGEDEAKLVVIPFISNKAHIVGLYLPRLEPTGRLSLRLEYADLSHIDRNSPVWYRHHIFRSGYTYEGKILGHHVGGAAEDYFAEIRADLPGGVTVGVSFDYEKRGVDQPVEEKHSEPALELSWALSPSLSLHGRYAWDRVTNFAFDPEVDKEFHLAEVGISGVW